MKYIHPSKCARLNFATIYRACGAIAIVGIAMGVSLPARAQFTVAWDNGGYFHFPVSAVVPANPPDGKTTSGQEFDLTGTVTNTSGQTVYVNSLTFWSLTQSNGQGLTFQNGAYIAGPYSNPGFSFWAYNPLGIAAGESYTGVISSVFTDSSTPQGLYNRDYLGGLEHAGTIDFAVYSDPGHTSYIGTYSSSNIAIQIGNITTTPEPGAMATMGLGLLGTAGWVMRRRRRG